MTNGMTSVVVVLSVTVSNNDQWSDQCGPFSHSEHSTCRQVSSHLSLITSFDGAGLVTFNNKRIVHQPLNFHVLFDSVCVYKFDRLT